MSIRETPSPSDIPTPITKLSAPIRPKHSHRRSITESTGTSFPKLHRPHHHHGHHTHHRTLKEKPKDMLSGYAHTQGGRNLWERGEKSEREKERDVVEGTKSEGVTPEQSRGPSRRTSLLGRTEEPLGGQFDAVEERVVGEGELAEAKEKAALRATELQNALSSLHTLSNNTTRRLDNTYYSVLEKLSGIQSTISSMKGLTVLMRDVHTDFLEESEEAVEEAEVALEAFEGFQVQQGRIEALAERVRAGRAKAESLGTRVEAVRRKVDGWEKVEVEWQESTRRRLRILWIVISVCGIICSGLMVFQYTPARTQGPGVIKGWDPNLIGGAEKDVERMKNESFTLRRSTVDAVEKMKETQDTLEDDPRLRAFDEL